MLEKRANIPAIFPAREAKCVGITRGNEAMHRSFIVTGIAMHRMGHVTYNYDNHVQPVQEFYVQ